MKYFFAILFTILIGAIIIHYATGEDSFKYSGKLQSDKTTIKAPNLLVPSFEPYYPGKPLNPIKPEIKHTPIKVIGEVSAIYIQSGQKVKKGQKLMVIKNQLFNDQLIMNQAAVNELNANNQELENNKEKIYNSRNKLSSTQADLENKLSELKSNRDKMKKKLDSLISLKKQLAKMPKIPTVPSLPVKSQQIKKPTAANGQIPTNLPDVNKINTGIAQLTAALLKMNSGISKIEAALKKFPDLRSKLTNASGELNDIQMLLGYQQNALSAVVNFSKSTKGYLTLKAPRAGTISVINVNCGDTICANQPLLDINTSNKMKVVIPFPVNISKVVKKNEKVLLRVDGIKRFFKGEVTFISSRVDLAPSTAVTKEVHLTRTENIEIETDNMNSILKDGMPVDVKLIGG